MPAPAQRSSPTFAAELPDEWEGFLADAAVEGRIVYQVKQLWESLTGKVEIERLSENSFGSLVPARGYFYLKGLIDFVFALVLLPVALPAMAIVAIAIRLDSKGPALFRQKRVGHAGKPIIVYKFRTMRSVDIEDERRALMTSDDDDRVTRVGRVLRTLRLDELPQIFNILKWEMSWIGPRPEAELLSAWYTSEIPFYRYRHVVKPGISGWAQVNQGHVAAVEDVYLKLHYDFYYIKYFSPWLDVLIVFRTIKTMLTGWGATLTRPVSAAGIDLPCHGKTIWPPLLRSISISYWRAISSWAARAAAFSAASARLRSICCRRKR